MKIIAAAGASGGHIFPALSFLEALKDKQQAVEAVLVLPKRVIHKDLEFDSRIDIKYISTRTLRFHLDLKNIAALLYFLKGSFESLILLLKFKPDIVIGFGGVDSVPLLFLAWLFRIRTIIHEQNVTPGRANKFLAKFADKIAVSFNKTKDYLGMYSNKLVFTGNPIRKDLKWSEKKEALGFFGFSENKFTILVMGGSLGSHKINTAFLSAISAMDGNYGLQIIHISGNQDYETFAKKYKEMGIKAKIFNFLKEMRYAYSCSDLVISRAGATTISELMFFKIPAILIPYPFAYGHQAANANILVKTGSAVMLMDNDLNGDALKERLEDFIKTPKNLENMRSSYTDVSKHNASEALAYVALSI